MVKLQLLGSVDVRDSGGRELHTLVSQPRRVALLAYLAAGAPRGFFRRDKLVTLFWPEATSENARHSLAQAIYVLRQSLGDDAVVSRGSEEVAIDSGLVSCDAVAFEQALDIGDLETALDLYRGPFLDGFHVSGAAVFERWVEDERVRLQERAAGAAWALAHKHIAVGHLVEAERTAQRAVLLVPTDESEVRRFVEALAAAGDRAAAVRFYEKAAQRLREEYDITPSDGTVALAEAVRRGNTASVRSHSFNRTTTAAVPVRGNPVGREASQDATETGMTAPHVRTELGRLVKSRSMRIGVAVAVTAIAGLVVRGALVGGEYRSSARRVADHVAFPKMVVVPPENRTRDPDAADWGLMAAEFVTQAIDRVGSIVVVPTGIVRDLVREMDLTVALPVREIARRTGARYAVAGSYMTSVGRVRFDVELLDAETGDMLRALDQVSGPVDSLESVVGLLAERVTGAAVALLDARAPFVRRPLPPSLEVFRSHMAMNEAFCEGRWQDAIELAQPALRAAPDYAPTLYLVSAAFGKLSRRREEDSVAALIEPYLDRLPTFTRLQFEWMRGLRRDNIAEATRSAEQLYRLWPSIFGLHSGLTAHLANRLDAALERLLAQDTETWCFRHWVGWWVETAEVYHQLGRYDEELEIARRGLQRFSNQRDLINAELRALVGLGRLEAVDSLLAVHATLSPLEQYSPGSLLYMTGIELKAHGYLSEYANMMDRALAWYASQPSSELRHERGRAFFYSERWSDADTLFAALIDDEPENVEYRGIRAVALAHLDRRAEAAQIANWLEELDRPYLSGAATRWRGAIAAALGHRDEAVRLLQQAIGEGVGHGMWQHREPDWEPLRDYLPWQELMRPKG